MFGFHHLYGPGERLTFSISDSPRTLSGEAERLVRRVASDLRFGLQTRNPEVLSLTEALDQALPGWFWSWSRPVEWHTNQELELRAERLQAALESGRLWVERLELGNEWKDDEPLPKLAPAPKPQPNTDTFFEVRVVDEIGQPLAGVRVDFEVNGACHSVATNLAGVSFLEHMQDSTAVVRLNDTDTLDQLLANRWKAARQGAPTGKFQHKGIYIQKPLGPYTVTAALTHTIVLLPPCCRIRLHDAVGNPLPNVPYRVTSGDFDQRVQRTDAQAWANIRCSICRPDKLELEWDHLSNGSFIYRREVHLDWGDHEDPNPTRKQLENLSYAEPDDFARDYGIECSSAEPGGAYQAELAEIFGARECKAERRG